MRKRLLLQLLVLVCAVGAYATEMGGYIYSADAKYKATGANIFVNGDFKSNYDGWTNEKNEAPSAVWELTPKAGPNGETVIKSTKLSNESGDSLVYVVPIQPGFYVFSYWVKAESSIQSSTANAAQNYLNFFYNTTGGVADVDATANGFVRFGLNSVYGIAWKQIVTTFTIENEGFFVLDINNMASNTMFTNFEILPVMEVYDTRIAERKLAYMQKLYNEPAFTEQKDDLLKPYMEVIEANLKGEGGLDVDDASTWAFLEDEVDPAVEEFLNVNAGNTCSTMIDGIKTERYLYGWYNWGYSQWNSYNGSTRNGWHYIGNRWGFSPNNGSLERPEEDGYVASAGIQRGTDYTLDCGMAVADDVFANTSLKPGFYMFSIEAQATAAQYSSNSDVQANGYGSNPGVEIAGPWMWIGNDTIVFKTYNETDALEHPTWKFSDETVVLNGTNWQRLYYIGEVKEGEAITGGFHFPVVQGTGGRYSLRNPEFRAVGLSQDQVDHLYAYDMIKVNRESLKAQLDEAVAENAKTKADGFPWGHNLLSDAITSHTNFYNSTFAWIDADGNEKNAGEVTLANKDEVIAHRDDMSKARRDYANTNKVYQTLVADIATCNGIYGDDAYAAADHPTFKAVIDKAQGMVEATGSADESEAFAAMDVELMTANEWFRMAIGSRATPVDLTYTLRNGGFEPWTSDQNYVGVEGGGSKDIYEANNWIFNVGSGGKQWQLRPNNAEYESGVVANMWRGTTAGPNGKASQTVTLTRPGIYEYRAKAYANEGGSGNQARWADYVAIARVFQNLSMIDYTSESCNDTIYKPNIRLFFGIDGTVSPADSCVLFKCAPDISSVGFSRYTPLTYSIILIKTDNETKTYELGLEARDNGATAGANGFGFGDNHLYYLGNDEAAYLAATKVDYDAICTEARSAIAKYKDAELKLEGYEAQRLSFINSIYRYMGDRANHPSEDAGDQEKYINAPVTHEEMQNAIHSIKENMKWLEALVNYDPEATGIKQIVTSEEKSGVVTDVYTITGAKVADSINDLKSLKKGLYIINGKKILVR